MNGKSQHEMTLLLAFQRALVHSDFAATIAVNNTTKLWIYDQHTQIQNILPAPAEKTQHFNNRCLGPKNKYNLQIRWLYALTS